MANLPPPRSYDVYFSAPGGSRFFSRNPNHGIAVADSGITWTADGRTSEAPFADIVSVHLQTATLGNAERMIDQCRIEFVNGTALVVSNASSSGLPDQAQTPPYRDFVRDLHAHLAAHTDGAIHFSAGMAQWRYNGLLVTMIIAGLFFVAAPLLLVAFTGDLYGLIIAAGGASLSWPFIELLRNNAPRDYRPDQLPDELLS
jgi:hypothetical protein